MLLASLRMSCSLRYSRVIMHVARPRVCYTVPYPNVHETTAVAVFCVCWRQQWQLSTPRTGHDLDHLQMDHLQIDHLDYKPRIVMGSHA